MSDLFKVYDIVNKTKEEMNYRTVCDKYPESNLLLLKEGCISIISVYKDGNKIAVINRVKSEEV